MKCPACGRENRTSAGFCAWCGERFETKPEGVAAEAAIAPTATQPAGPAAEAGVAPANGPAALAAETPPSPLPAVPAEEAMEAAPGAGAEEAAEPAEVATEGGATPLRPGDVLTDRYEVVEVVESGPDSNTYRAKDRYGCAACGFDENVPGDEYCRQCGASLEKARYVTIVERLRLEPEHYDLRFEQGERDYFVTAEPQPKADEAIAEGQALARRLRLIWGRATDKGQQRDLNEDYLEAWLYARGSGGLLGLFVVADGLGGHDSGEVASRLTTDTVWETLRQSVWEPIIRGEVLQPEALEDKLEAAIKTASQAVYDARVARNSEMSSTLTLALIVDDVAYIGNVGDSRTYLWNAKGLQRITKDHSLVQRLVDTGQIEPRDVYAHPQRNVIYQSIGDRPDVHPDIFRQQLAVDDHLILCSDGLWEMVRDEGLEEVLLAEMDPQRACERLVQNANLAGGEDNISVIIVQAMAA